MLAVIALLAMWFLWPEDAEPPAPPLAAPVTRGDIDRTVAASATLEASNLVDVGAQVSGQLKKLHVQLGDIVSAGDFLAEIDDFIQRTRLDSAEASLESLEVNTHSIEASLELSRGELERQERLMQAQATTEVEYDRAIVDLAQAEANLARHLLQIEQAHSSVEEAKALLEFTRIAAPSSGTVVSIYAQEGQTLNAAQLVPVILRIGDLRTIRVSAKVSEADMRRLTPGMEAYFTIPADGEHRWQGHLEKISPIPQGPIGLRGLAQFDAFMRVENTDGALLPGMTAKVFFVDKVATDVLKVPLGAVTFTDGPTSAAAQYALKIASPSRGQGAQARNSNASDSLRGRQENGPEGRKPSSGADGRAATVHVVDQSGELTARSVRVGVSNDVEAEVLSGLAVGETVVTGAPEPLTPQLPAFLGD